MKLSLIIQAIDRATAPLRKVTSATRDLAGKGLGAVTRAAAATDRALAKVGNQRFARLKASLRDLGTNGMRLAEIGAYKLGAGIGSAIRKVAQLGVGLAALGAGAAAYAGGRFLGGIIKTAGDFEQMGVSLETLLGSARKSKEAMSWISEFAAKTPYEIAEVTQAFIALQQSELNPMKGSLESVGNAAAAMGISLQEAVVAVQAAMRGESDPIERLGLFIKKSGDTATLSYSVLGKKIRKTVTGAEALSAAIKEAFDAKYSAAMIRQSTTLYGLWSNIKDAVARFQLKIADAGWFKVLKENLAQALEWVNKIASNGQMDAWAKAISDRLIEMTRLAAKFVKETDWNKVGADLRIVAQAVVDIANAFVKAVIWSQKLQGSINLSRSPMAGWGIIPGIAGMFSGPAKSAPAAPKTRPFWPGQGPMRPGAKPMSLPSGAFGGGKTQVGGRVSIELRTQPGTTATVKSASTTNRNVPIEINTGRARASV